MEHIVCFGRIWTFNSSGCLHGHTNDVLLRRLSVDTTGQGWYCIRSTLENYYEPEIQISTTEEALAVYLYLAGDQEALDTALAGRESLLQPDLYLVGACTVPRRIGPLAGPILMNCPEGTVQAIGRIASTSLMSTVASHMVIVGTQLITTSGQTVDEAVESYWEYFRMANRADRDAVQSLAFAVLDRIRHVDLMARHLDGFRA